jgi:signal transduction histidine kinase/CheY-like chemotaxis protein/HPt (histidine-containing phosphotransfer) domain-containing protein
MTMSSVKSLKKVINKKFLIFSCILFFIFALSAITAFSISTRQINHSFIEQQLSRASETIRLRLATAVDSELALVQKMADTPIIRQYFMNPSDPVLKFQAYAEISIYKEHFNNKILYWVNDIDKIFYSTRNAPYVVNPDDPNNYWYNLTLYETEKYIFNINYNPDLEQIYLWVNVPVFTETQTGKKPIGMVGTGINLIDFSDFLTSGYQKFDENITTYMFNKYNEITQAEDYELIRNKVRLDGHLGETGKELIKTAHELSGGESRSFIYDKKIYLVNSIPAMEWYLSVSYPTPSLLSLNHAMNTVFFSMLFLILFLFIIINAFIARSENAITKQNLQLIEANRKAESASKAKSDFLAKMSHEIRTPMNAITGMAELLLRGELSNEAQGYARDIKQAGNNLVSLINDILDLSKIEAGKLEIVPVKYMLSSLINDTVNIIRTKLKEKPIRFFTNIDGNIPNSLIGDEVRLRQILINLLSNAIKYTEKGYIGLTITADKQDDKQVLLRIDVADSGKGIRPEHQTKLFDEFVRVDKNQGIEGTGLGLSITRRLCAAMDGKINMESEYGKGSVFTVIIPQGIESKEPFAAVKEPEKKKVLVYESRINYAKSVCWSLENMKVPYKMVTNFDDFKEALYSGPQPSLTTGKWSGEGSPLDEWFYVFSGYGLYEKIKPLMEQNDSVFCGGKKPHLALMVEWGIEIFIPNVHFISIPVQSMSIANTLNSKADHQNYFEGSVSSGVIRHSFHNARLLVVDDIAVNLKVAEGLLSPYNAKIDTCLSGTEAINLVKQNKYDLILMDHMMPEMDGIEATAIIRSWEKDQKEKSCELLLERPKGVPIIALTANAVVGMKEMFIKNGFNDFISKPIDVSKLDEILNRWIPKEKKAVNDEEAKTSKEQDKLPQKDTDSLLPAISKVDTVKGIAMLRGKLDLYKKVLSMFCVDADERLAQLQKMPDTDTLQPFIIHVHSLKSVSASIGAQEISSYAAELETAGKAANMTFIREHLPDFTVLLAELIKNIRTVITNP